ncbi:MAG: hypothetical protein PHG23_00105 [Candidatus Pacebacteria bacterium]|nr:hypothetical protein [Candidatus Paceibacterota bacterium]
MPKSIDIDSKNYSVKEFVEKLNFDECVFDLLKFIEKDNKKVKDFLITKYLGASLPANTEEYVLEYFINNSVFSAATMANPATSIVTELLYVRPNLNHPIDKYFLASKSGKAIRSRIEKVEENIHSLIEKYFEKNEKVLIGNVGGGPSRDISDVFSKYYVDNDNIDAVSIDRDGFSIKRGKLLAKIGNVENKIDFLGINFMKHKPKKKFDIILLVGVLCGLPSETCVLVLKNTKRMLARGGCIMASNVTPKMLEDDPFTYFLMEKILNWKLIFKEEELLKNIFRKSGLKWQQNFTDEYGFHNMGIGI